jgi:glyoxylase-like metal-dependent hydrolase (beta-lactamase superfamily II)
MRKFLKILGYLLLAIILLFIILAAVYFPGIKKLYSGYEVLPQDSSLTIILGGGGNSVIFNSDSEVLVVDTKVGRAAKKLNNDVKALAGNKPVIVVNTHSDRDHTGGNPLYKGARFITGKIDESYWKLASGDDHLPDVWVTDTFDIKLGEETVSLISIGQAHTWSDIVVFFHNRGVLVTGDLIFNHMNAALAEGKGSNGWKYIDALKRLKQIKDIKKVVPGHGAIGGPELIDVMLTYIEDMALVANNPGKEKEITKKYKNWVRIPGALSPGIVIDNLRKHRQE